VSFVFLPDPAKIMSMKSNETERTRIIRKRMKEAGVSARRIREETGLSLTTIYGFMKGTRSSWLLDRWFWDRLGLDINHTNPGFFAEKKESHE
jgi:hypothetical protein